MRGADSPAKESSAPPPPLIDAETPLPVTPGWSAIKLYKFLPLRGISCSCIRSTCPDTRPCSVSTIGALVVTVTLSWTPDTSRVKSRRTVSLMPTLTDSRSALRNPSLTTSTR